MMPHEHIRRILVRTSIFFLPPIARAQLARHQWVLSILIHSPYSRSLASPRTLPKKTIRCLWTRPSLHSLRTTQVRNCRSWATPNHRGRRVCPSPKAKAVKGRTKYCYQERVLQHLPKDCEGHPKGSLRGEDAANLQEEWSRQILIHQAHPPREEELHRSKGPADLHWTRKRIQRYLPGIHEMVFEGEVSETLPNRRYGEQGGVYKIQERGYPSDTRVICIHIYNLTMFLVFMKSLWWDQVSA